MLRLISPLRFRDFAERLMIMIMFRLIFADDTPLRFDLRYIFIFALFSLFMPYATFPLFIFSMIFFISLISWCYFSHAIDARLLS